MDDVEEVLKRPSMTEGNATRFQLIFKKIIDGGMNSDHFLDANLLELSAKTLQNRLSEALRWLVKYAPEEDRPKYIKFRSLYKFTIVATKDEYGVNIGRLSSKSKRLPVDPSVLRPMTNTNKYTRLSKDLDSDEQDLLKMEIMNFVRGDSKMITIRANLPPAMEEWFKIYCEGNAIDFNCGENFITLQKTLL